MQASAKGQAVTLAMNWKHVLAVLLVLVIAVLAYAWIDGGREPLRDISQPIPVPETT
ncbi:MAG: hypothetical protein R3D89_05935 [Sphingomonadaceae bacterium]|jgi:hypothetical protein